MYSLFVNLIKISSKPLFSATTKSFVDKNASNCAFGVKTHFCHPLPALQSKIAGYCAGFFT